MSRELITIEVKRRIPGGSDGGGGYIEAGERIVYPNLKGRIRFKSFKRKSTRLEQGAHNSPGPGLSTAAIPFALFYARDNDGVLPDIRINDVLLAAGKAYKVHFPRTYERTQQVDLELQVTDDGTTGIYS